MKLILASGSPRRRELLAQLGVPFEVIPANTEESTLPGESAPQTALRLAREKARAIASKQTHALVLGADTVVEVDGLSLGKPADLAEMERHLRLLSGRTHQVHTGLCIIDGATGLERQAVESTEVEFDVLQEHELQWYLEKGEGWDKAGSYGYQGLASVLIRGIWGCYFNVVGLPLARLRRLMREMGHELIQQPNNDEGIHP